MQAVQFVFSYPRYGYTMVAGKLNQSEFYGPRSCVALSEIPEPRLRGPRWAKVRSMLSGFCGSDLGAIALHDSPTLEPFVSFPFVLGHENYGVLEEVGDEIEGFAPGDRVTVIPSLGCEVRDIDPTCAPCAAGDTSICENFREGSLSPGLNIGNCRDTGGGWSKYFLAHGSQLVKVPDALTDEQAVMIEPTASALHPMMTALPADGDQVLVIGCGMIGLGIIAGITALGIDCHVTAVDPVALNRGKALEKGAHVCIDPCEQSIYDRTVEITGAKRYKPTLEKTICMGGFDRVFDCVGSTDSINQSIRVAASAGTIVLIGVQIPGKVDWSPVWMKGLTIIGNLGYGPERFRGGTPHTFEVVLTLIQEGKLDMSDIITHRFTLDDYKHAIEVNFCKSRYGAIKTIFDLSDL